jgi:hypothetical protein
MRDPEKRTILIIKKTGADAPPRLELIVEPRPGMFDLKPDEDAGTEKVESLNLGSGKTRKVTDTVVREEEATKANFAILYQKVIDATNKVANKK